MSMILRYSSIKFHVQKKKILYIIDTLNIKCVFIAFITQNFVFFFYFRQELMEKIAFKHKKEYFLYSDFNFYITIELLYFVYYFILVISRACTLNF